jgi:hypothetical protein
MLLAMLLSLSMADEYVRPFFDTALDDFERFTAAFKSDAVTP